MGHYSPAQKPQVLADAAEAEASCIVRHFGPMLFGAGGYTRIMLCYQGMSGVACATALMLALFRQTGITVEMAYVRKDGEYSHGTDIETEMKSTHWTGCSGEQEYTVIFVDDFISSGRTANITLRKLAEKITVHRKVYICQFNGAVRGLKYGSLKTMLSREYINASRLKLV